MAVKVKKKKKKHLGIFEIIKGAVGEQNFFELQKYEWTGFFRLEGEYSDLNGKNIILENGILWYDNDCNISNTQNNNLS